MKDIEAGGRREEIGSEIQDTAYSIQDAGCKEHGAPAK
jgi:hypothetical protein